MKAVVPASQKQHFINLMQQAEHQQALLYANQLNQQYPEDATSYNLMGDALLMVNDHQNAIKYYQLSIGINPQQTDVYLLLGKLFDIAAQGDNALLAYSQALKLEPSNTKVLSQVGDYLSSIGHFNDAQTLLTEAIDLGEKSACFKLLNLFERQGDKRSIKQLLTQYADEFQQANDEHFLGYANARLYVGQYQQVLQDLTQRSLVGQTKSWLKQYYLLLAKTQEKLKHYEQAFAAFELMNQQSQTAYHLKQEEDNSKAYQAFSSPYLSQHDATSIQPTPIFIVGLPRTGTSLLEKVIATHAHVVAGGEMPLIYPLYQQLTQDPSQIKHAMQWYVEQLNHHVGEQQQVRYIIDKLPTNYSFIGMIKQLMPHAKIIYCRRNAMDNGLSIFRQNFSEQVSYASDFEHIAHFMSLERQQMAHWLQQYPDDIHSVNFETLVTDFKQQTQDIFKFLQLDWSDAVFDFYKDKRFTHTASYDQVKQPINKAVIEQYKHYQPYLTALASALKKHAVAT